MDSNRHGTTPQISAGAGGEETVLEEKEEDVSLTKKNGSASVTASLVSGWIKKEEKGAPSGQTRVSASPIDNNPRASQLVVAIWDPL